MPSCAVFGCHNSTSKTKGMNIRYYGFPKNPDFIKMWKNACHRGDLNPKTSYVCSSHFAASSLFIPLKHRLLNYQPRNTRNLKHDAVPTEMLPSMDLKKVTHDTRPKRLLQQKKLNEIENALECVESLPSSTASSNVHVNTPKNVNMQLSNLNEQSVGEVLDGWVDVLKEEVDSLKEEPEHEDSNVIEVTTSYTQSDIHMATSNIDNIEPSELRRIPDRHPLEVLNEADVLREECDPSSESGNQQPNTPVATFPPTTINNLNVVKCLFLKTPNNNDIQQLNLKSFNRQPTGQALGEMDVLKKKIVFLMSGSTNQHCDNPKPPTASTTPINLLVITSNNINMQPPDSRSQPVGEVLNETDVLKKKINSLICKNSKLQLRCKQLKKEKDHLLHHVKTANNNYSKRVHKILETVFTPGQIKMLLHPEKSKFRWSLEDMRAAMALRKISPKAYHYLRLNNYPLPPRSTLMSKPWAEKLNRSQETASPAPPLRTITSQTRPAVSPVGTEPLVLRNSDRSTLDSNAYSGAHAVRTISPTVTNSTNAALVPTPDHCHRHTTTTSTVFPSVKRSRPASQVNDVAKIRTNIIVNNT